MQAYFGIFRPEKEAGWEGWYNVTFPDVPGAITAGHDLSEALSMAVEALSMILGGGRKGRDYTDPSTYEAILAKAAPDDLVFPVIPDERIIIANSPKKRVSVMLPGSQLSLIASITKDIEGLDRSKFISKAVDFYVAEKYPEAVVLPEASEAAEP